MLNLTKLKALSDGLDNGLIKSMNASIALDELPELIAWVERARPILEKIGSADWDECDDGDIVQWHSIDDDDQSEAAKLLAEMENANPEI